MTLQGDHVVLKCRSTECGMRYPSPADDPRRDACPLCDTPVDQVAVFSAPPPQVVAAPSSGQLVGVLDNVRSALNVGTMLRSADGAALDHVYLGGLTAPAAHPKVKKTALGAEESVATTSVLDVLPSLDGLRGEGYEIWAVDLTERSELLETVTHRPAKLAFVLGSENAGVDPEILQSTDRHLHLDMRGTKTTLNVGVVFGTVAYWLRSLPIA